MAYTPDIGRTFWFELDRATLYNAAFRAVIARAGARDVQDEYRSARQSGTYPAAFKQTFLSRRDDWILLADVQTNTIRDFLGSDWADVQAAFEDFAQGTLLDADKERKRRNDSIHMMDGQDDSEIVGYHRWHASIRLFQLLGIGDADWWEKLDRLVGLGWGIQSFARPKQQQVPNPAIGRADLQALRDAWLPLTPDRRDRQYDLTREAVGFHPTPKKPA